eukprot:CAMPEP_0168270954 /NCGR_PEP_ID=MMETSP0141_2-20121125/15303_1 /TAXON_ID=44445 /ORGANISM="Pseudo-nitzschia australis, Strain 10249 10 AB" /LENGTH=72 /DNA_ID=CAMNT_0008212035 /DNA_START=40 /DNA_END=254 /DNA_ORIENTATION=-
MVASRTGPSTVLGDQCVGGPKGSGGGACVGTVGSGSASSDGGTIHSLKTEAINDAIASRMACTWVGVKASGV